MSKRKKKTCRWLLTHGESEILKRALRHFMLDLLGEMCGEYEDGGKQDASVADSYFESCCADYKAAAKLLETVEDGAPHRLERYDLIMVKESLTSYVHNMVELQYEIESNGECSSYEERRNFADEVIDADRMLEKCLGILNQQKLHIVATDGNGERHDLGVFPPQNA